MRPDEKRGPNRNESLKEMLMEMADTETRPRMALLDHPSRRARRRNALVTVFVSVGVIAASVVAIEIGDQARPTAPPPGASASAADSPSPITTDSSNAQLLALCTADSQIETVLMWRSQQLSAHKLSATQADAVSQSVAVQYLALGVRSDLPSSVSGDAATLASASGTLAAPHIGLTSSRVISAQEHLRQACEAGGAAISVYGQGG